MQKWFRVSSQANRIEPKGIERAKTTPINAFYPSIRFVFLVKFVRCTCLVRHICKHTATYGHSFYLWQICVTVALCACVLLACDRTDDKQPLVFGPKFKASAPKGEFRAFMFTLHVVVVRTNPIDLSRRRFGGRQARLASVHIEWAYGRTAVKCMGKRRPTALAHIFQHPTTIKINGLIKYPNCICVCVCAYVCTWSADTRMGERIFCSRLSVESI